MFIFLLTFLIISITSFLSMIQNGFDLNTFITFIVSTLISVYFYFMIKDENDDWGCD